jgi:hypothetical protein
MVRAGCAATTCALAPRPFTQAESRWQNHRDASPTPHSFTLSTCRRQGRRGPSTPRCDFLIDSPAIRNARNSPANNIITFSNRQQFASLRAHFAPHESPRSNCFSPPTIFLISSRPVLEFDVTHSQKRRNVFLISSFSALFSGSWLVRPSAFHTGLSLERPVSVAVPGASRITSHESRVTKTRSAE